jgi:hypothetical protein
MNRLMVMLVWLLLVYATWRVLLRYGPILVRLVRSFVIRLFLSLFVRPIRSLRTVR